MSGIEALVVRAQSREFTVRDAEGGERIAVVPKKLRRAHKDLVDPVAVGDRVLLEPASGEDWVVTEVLPRTNELARPASGRGARRQLIAANLDTAVIVLAAADPPWKPATIDRYLVLAARGGVPSRVFLNKIDLQPDLPRDPVFGIYPPIGVAVNFGSAEESTGIEGLARDLDGKLAVLIGPSGVGKSSLLGRLIGERLRTAEVSERTGKGIHTTTWVEMRRLPGGGALIDSPGIRTLSLAGLEPHELDLYFPEFQEPRQQCRFRDCHHRAEPGCAVKAEVEAGTIAGSRYDSYERIYDSLEAGEG